MVDKQYLSKKHTGMKVSMDGVLSRIVNGNGQVRKDQRYMLESILEHLKQTATRFYAGDISAVDEFFQLYCLDDNRPEDQNEIKEN